MKHRNTKGFSLLELLVALGILMLIYVVVTRFQLNVINYNKTSNDSLQSAQDARSILRTMVGELRTMQQGNNGSFPLATAATSSVSFFSDADHDGLKEQIRYFLVATTLKKGIIIPTGNPLVYNPTQEKISILAYNIKNGTTTSLFEYFNNTYAGTSSPMTQPVVTSNVRLVKINLTIDADPNRSPLPRLYTSQVMLRNLKDNL